MASRRSAWSLLRPRLTTADWHDDFNLACLGALNTVHVGWWLGLFPASALTTIFLADVAYIVLDACWLAFVPECVNAKVKGTLLIHHGVVLACVPISIGKPVLMAHLLRTWSVEIASWNHIAMRRLRPPDLALMQHLLNKPLFVVLRIIGFPLTWFVYARERAALPAAVIAAHAPPWVHVPLSLTHALMYGLMLKWGYTLLIPQNGAWW